jgi:hypothetical protein
VSLVLDDGITFCRVQVMDEVAGSTLPATYSSTSLQAPPRLSTWTRILDAAGCTSDIKGIHTAILAPSRADLDESTGERLRVGSRQPVNHEWNNQRPAAKHGNQDKYCLIAAAALKCMNDGQHTDRDCSLSVFYYWGQALAF